MTTPTPRPATEPARLAAVRATGLLDTGPEESFDRLARLAATLLQAPMAFVTLVDEQRSFWKSAVGTDPADARQNPREESFCQYVVDRRGPLVVGDAARDPLTRDNPSVTLMGVAAWAGYPLRAPGGEVLGSFCVVDTSPREWTARDREVLETLAAAASAEVGMRVAVAGAEERARRLGFLADASALISSLPDYAGLPARLTRFCVPDFAQTAVIHELVEDQLEAVGTADLDEDRQAQLEALPPVPAAGSAPGSARLAQALRTTEPVLTRLAPDDQLAGPIRVTGPGPDRWVITAPLRVRNRPVGVLTWVAGPERTYTADDLALVTDFAYRVAQAWDHARLFAQRSEVAATLQRSLLPAHLPTVPGLELAVRYVASDASVEVGGDFYDVFPAGGGEWVAVIGDVSGRGVQAAGMTGLARHTLRAIGRDLGPAAALDRLNAVLCEAAEDERFATVACARLRPGDDGAVTIASGGHCRPVLVRADGTVEPVGAPGMLLGLFDEVDLTDVELRLGVGDALVYYTDGVIEARGADGLFGEDRLLDVLRQAGDRSAEQTAAGVLAAVEAYRTVGADDDLAVLVLRRVAVVPVVPATGSTEPSAPAVSPDAPREQRPGPPAPVQRATAAVAPTGAVFSAAAARRITGLTAADLAAWPNRYGLVVPVPTSDGTATYTAHQLAQLSFLRQRQAAGAGEVAAHAELADTLRSGGAATEPPYGDTGSDPEGARCTVLLVDRDPYVLSSLADAVASRGHQPVTATSIEQAVRAAEEHDLSAAVVEVLLAGQSGLDVCAALSARSVPVLVVSSRRAASDAFRTGAQAFLAKPLDPAALTATVQLLLDRTQCRDGAMA